ncbi:MAG: GAF domain-containing protein, partial [Burkholderiales bacterium]
MFNGMDGSIVLVQGDRFQLVAASNAATLWAAGPPDPVPLNRKSAVGQAILDRTVVNVGDTEAADAPRYTRQYAQRMGYRAIAAAPLLREGAAIGAIAVTRSVSGALDTKQLDLLKTFADQAVIAIENVRLFNETKESLERQTATAEILKVIASSPSDVQPVLNTVAEYAALICNVPNVTVWLADGEVLRTAATYSREPGAIDWRGNSVPIRATSVNGQAILERRTIHIEDVEPLLDTEYSDSRDRARLLGVRAIVSVPMIREGVAIGTIALWRREARLFSEAQVALLQTFADQAVIAIQNVRLFNETKEALERQTATAEILKVISSSPTDVQPVFDAIVRSAMRLAEPWNAAIAMREGNLIQLRAVASPRVSQVNLHEVSKIFPLPFDPEKNDVARAIAGRRVIERPDAQGPEAGEVARRIARSGLYRSGVFVPLVRENEGIGGIVLSHPQKGARLTEKQLALIQIFAHQAVIAIENVRLFQELQGRNRELTEALEQ